MGDWAGRVDRSRGAVNALLIVLLTAVAAVGGLTVVTREPVRQAVIAGVFGLLIAALFYTVQAPDVALSELGVAGAGVPVMLLLAIAKIRTQERQAQARHDDEEEE